MRIAYDAAPLLNPRTGIGHYAATLLDRLLAIDPETEFQLFALTRSADGSGIRRKPRVHLRHHRIPARLAVTAWEILGWPPGERLTGETDVVHGTNYWIPPARRRKGIVTIHDLTFWLYPEMCTPQVRRYRWIVPRVLTRCELVITPSETIRQQVTDELGFPEDRIVVTPEGIRDPFRQASPDPSLKNELGLTGDYLIFAGTQEPRKNLDRLIQAFALLGDLDLQLVIAGPEGWGSADLPALARKLRIQDRVLFPGYLGDSELASLTAGARAFVFPTLYEGFGLPPLEAMAAGVPVVAGRGGALPEVLGEAPFWCDPLDVQSIAPAIEQAVTDEPARAAAIEKGRARASLYDWDETARRTLEAYRRVASGSI
jgi:glycosyltransferase involved in cell wall biosynthesis